MARLLRPVGALGQLGRALAFHNRERRRSAQDVTAFDALIASPTALGTAAAGASLDPVTLPANAWLAVRLDAVTSEGDIALDVSGGRTVFIAGAGANVVQDLGWHEKDREVTVRRSGAPAGSVDLILLDEWRRPFVIGEGTFS